MANLPIIQPDNPILRKRARKVTSFDAKFQTLIDDMLETLEKAPGVGLAAPQVAVPLRVFIARLPDDEEGKKEFGDNAGVLYVFANPEFVKTSKEMVEGIEGCLSIPGWVGTVERHEQVVIRGQDRFGKPIKIKAKGWLARVFQHEADHLDGRLYIDIAKEVWQPTEEDEEETALADQAKAE
ncbi:MAG: peptide deformylase [Anaerolineae bacterium]|nr:peptide deformylase [Anaerolineae bacterium]